MTQTRKTLTNGKETFAVTIRGNGQAVDAVDSSYQRCTASACDHSQAPTGAVVWHDVEHTETLWTHEWPVVGYCSPPRNKPYTYGRSDAGNYAMTLRTAAYGGTWDAVEVPGDFYRIVDVDDIPSCDFERLDNLIDQVKKAKKVDA